MIQIMSAVVLRAEDIGEFDQRLTLYTKELGKIKAKVAGIKKSVSKLRAMSVPFAVSKLQIYLHGSGRAGLRDPGRVVGGEVLLSHPALRNEWGRMIQCASFCETLDVLTYPFYPNLKEYECLHSTLNQMEATSHPLMVRLRSTLILLKILGYSLKYHPAWKSFTERQRNLIKALAKWDCESKEEAFSRQETEEIDRMVTDYLALYLPFPLKTQVFRRKLEVAGSI